eukprot:4494646-Amphidinium_carterae.1
MAVQAHLNAISAAGDNGSMGGIPAGRGTSFGIARSSAGGGIFLKGGGGDFGLLLPLPAFFAGGDRG